MVTEIKNIGGIWHICTGALTKRLGYDKMTPSELTALNEFIRDSKADQNKTNSTNNFQNK